MIRTYRKNRMTRNEDLHLLISQANANGFDLRRWYTVNIAPEWPGTDEAIEILTTEGRFFALVFSHDFARSFWSKGEPMQFVVPASTYSRVNGKGQVVTINRKPFTRRAIKADVWKYHVRQMAVSEDPIRYLHRFLPTHPDLHSSYSATENLPAAG